MPGTSFVQAVKASFSESIGDIVFSMEDGPVSIFGLVFGVAASASNSQTVLLAGATGLREIERQINADLAAWRKEGHGVG